MSGSGCCQRPWCAVRGEVPDGDTRRRHHSSASSMCVSCVKPARSSVMHPGNSTRPPNGTRKATAEKLRCCWTTHRCSCAIEDDGSGGVCDESDRRQCDRVSCPHDDDEEDDAKEESESRTRSKQDPPPRSGWSSTSSSSRSSRSGSGSRSDNSNTECSCRTGLERWRITTSPAAATETTTTTIATSTSTSTTEYLWGERKWPGTSLWKRWRWKAGGPSATVLGAREWNHLLVCAVYLLAMLCCLVAAQQQGGGGGATDVLSVSSSSAAAAAANGMVDTGAVITSEGKVCSSVDVRNLPTHLERLKDCRVVEGFVQIMLIDKYKDDSFDNYSFPLLTEITGYLMMFRINGLQTLGQLFPNLTVIRGTELANNYALVIYELMHLKELGLTSLVHIERGGVRIEKNSNLCHAGTIDWNAIAPNGDNYINSNQNANECTTCPSNVTSTLSDGSTALIKCPQRDANRITHAAKESYLCWSNKHCQQKCPADCPPKSCTETGACCSRHCVGRCGGVNGTECMACTKYNYVDAGGHVRCVPECPKHLFLFSQSRCVTAEECYKLYKPLQRTSESTEDFPYIPIRGECRLECPEDFTIQRNPATGRRECVPCNGQCRTECNSMVIESISQIQQLRGCTIIKGSLSIRLRQLGGENVVRELQNVLQTIEEIDGYLTIIRSYALMSLGFFKKLRVIHGNTLNANISLSVLDNQNLQELWNQDVEIKRGNVMFNGNPMLCVKKITELKKNFGPSVKIENEDQLHKSNGVRMACEIVKLATSTTKISLDTAIIQWEPFKDLPDMRQLLGYVVYYIEAPHQNVTFYDGRDACNSEGWRVDDVPNWQEKGESSHILTRLQPYTQYAYYVKTYTLSSENMGGQTDITYFTTAPGQPRMVRNLQVVAEKSSVSIKWEEPIKMNGKLTEYRVSATLNDEKNDMINQRNYCDHEIEKPTAKPNITPQSPIGTTPSPPKESSQVCSVEECASFCPAGGSSGMDQRVIDANDIEMSINFEDWLHNYVYIKNTKATSRKRRQSEDLVVSANNSYLFPKNTENVSQPTPTVVSNEQVAGESYYRSLTDSTNMTNITFPLGKFKHSALYQINVVACREKAAKVNNTFVLDDATTFCGPPQLISFRTPRLLEADNIPVGSIQLEEQSNTTQRVVRVQWKGPAKPNGVVVSYSIKYQRLDLDSVQAITRCVTVHTFNRTGYFLLTKLEAGNYSVRIMATTTAGDGLYSTEKYIYLEKRESESSWAHWVIALVLTVILLTVGLVAVYFVRQKYLPMSNMRLFAHVNPDYAGVTYKVDEWEVPREHIIQLEELGQGSFGMVYKGIVTKLGTDANIPCAIKTVNESATERERESFLIEATVMKEFNTHHVVRLLGVVSIGQPTLVIMELMANGDLKSYLRRHRPDYENGEELSPQPPTLKQIYQMAIEIADGMAYLSAKKFVHRDLAARNCMVADDLTVKIGDFGMTRDIYETDYYRKGTKGFLPVRWMAPESLKDGMFSSSSDVFSYGVVLWEMATLASQPYQGLTNDQVLRYVIDGGVMERPENCPDKLYDLMRICWQHRASARPPFMEIINLLLVHANDRFMQVSFYSAPSTSDSIAQPGQGLMDDVTAPLRANEDDLDEDDDEPYSIEMTDSRLMQNNGPKPDIRSPHSPQSNWKPNGLMKLNSRTSHIPRANN